MNMYSYVLFINVSMQKLIVISRDYFLQLESDFNKCRSSRFQVTLIPRIVFSGIKCYPSVPFHYLS